MSIILHAPTIAHAWQVPAVLTVEAEYGAHVWEGSLYTAAHHQPSGPYAGRHRPGLAATGRPSPCNDLSIPLVEQGIVGISHVDLDTVGGVLRASPAHAHLFAGVGTSDWWTLAEAVDVRGAHRLRELLASQCPGRPLDAELLNAQFLAYWAWSRAQPRAAFDRVTDMTHYFLEAGTVLAEIFAGDAGRIAAGEQLGMAEVQLNQQSFVRRAGNHVVYRRATQFVNHLYRTPYNDALLSGVVAWNPQVGSVTLSIDDTDLHPGISCRTIAQGLWGSQAGGHDGIAGSPRGVPLPEIEAVHAAEALEAALAGTG